MGPGAALGGSGVGRTDCKGECCSLNWCVAAGKLEGEEEGAERMRSSARLLESDIWQLLFMLHQFILEKLVVFYAISHPSLSNRVIREHRLCTAINIFFLCLR